MHPAALRRMTSIKEVLFIDPGHQKYDTIMYGGKMRALFFIYRTIVPLSSDRVGSRQWRNFMTHENVVCKLFCVSR